MEFTTQNLGPIKLVGLTKKISMDAVHDDITAMYTQFFAHKYSDSIENKASNDLIAVYYNYTFEPFSYHMFLGVPVTKLADVSSDLSMLEIPEQSYAAYSLPDAAPQTVATFWSNIWASHLPYQRVFTYDLEIYSQSASDQAPSCSVFIAQ